MNKLGYNEITSMADRHHGRWDIWYNAQQQRCMSQAHVPIGGLQMLVTKHSNPIGDKTYPRRV